MNREFVIRGGVTLGLGPLMVQTYGLSDLKRELGLRIREAVDPLNVEAIADTLLISISVGGPLGKRDLAPIVHCEATVPLLLRSVREKTGSPGLLRELAALPGAAASLVSAAASSAPPGEKVALPELFVPPRITSGDAGKKSRVGRNDACPCGSGKKFKRCHMDVEEVTPTADAAGTPGLTPSEVFWFRDVSEELGRICHHRLASGGPRAGETLFWPVAFAPVDELDLRLEQALLKGHDLRDLLDRAWVCDYWDEEEVARILLRAFPPAGWFAEEFVTWLRTLSKDRLDRMVLFGEWTGAQVLALRKAKGARLQEVMESLAETDQGLADACALTVAGHDRLAYVALLSLRGMGCDLPPDEVALFSDLEGILAPRFGRPILALNGTRSSSAPPAEHRNMDSLDRLITHLKREVTQERELRQQVQSAWTPGVQPGQEGSLRTELRRLRSELKTERHASREALRDVQRFRQRERVRLIRGSHLEADVVAALVDDDVEEETPAEETRGRTVVYAEAFRALESRIPASTLERLRDQVAAFARGERVREAKRMEALDGVWTLRAGLHYRAFLKVRSESVEVTELIAREDLENVLNRMRR